MEVWLHFRVIPGACTNTGDPWFGVYPPFAWHSARADTAQKRTILAPDIWMGAFHEADPNYGLASGRWGGEGNDILPDGLFTSGTHVDYYVSTNCEGSANSFEMRNEEPGYENLPDDVEVLPSFSGDVGEGQYPCVLYCDHNDMRGTQRWMEDALRCVPTTWDRYDKRAPSSSRKTGIGRSAGSEKGATLTQLQGYKSVLLDAGAIYSGVENADVDLFTSYLAGASASEPKFLSIQGNDVARYLNAAAARKTFMNNYLQATYVNRYYYSTSGNTNWCVNLTSETGNYIRGGAAGDTVCALKGNMCPNSFNMIDIQTGSTTGKAELKFVNPSSPSQSYYAQVANQVKDANQSILYRTVLSSYATDQVRSVGCPGGVSGWQFGDSVGICTDPLKGWQREVRDKVRWGDMYGVCASLSTSISIPGAVNVGFVDALKGAYPNPMNPSTTINFSLKTRGKVSLRVFDASGRLVRKLVDSRLEAGRHTVSWDGRNDRGLKLGSGVYFYQIETEGGFKSVKKIVILK
ncbi:MAG: T9SS type A sorting domain-containing protein [Candidatus Eisenbacteria bacterium]|nr:T9SS type A sorting domain-containing protein [Candidatus Eisenbacteria bacterium]